MINAKVMLSRLKYGTYYLTNPLSEAQITIESTSNPENNTTEPTKIVNFKIHNKHIPSVCNSNLYNISKINNKYTLTYIKSRVMSK